MPRRGSSTERRRGKLLVAVRGLSGHSYPAGTIVSLTGRGAAVDAWVGGEWVPLQWWEFAEASPHLG
ncbi:MAG: hypothetical protein H0U12_08115 [Thermoleophilaceae bacterium]|nr:hypothetical protein [Thermoleophilaceae bacterium]